jgi:hypothetical protein
LKGALLVENNPSPSIAGEELAFYDVFGQDFGNGQIHDH